MTNPDLVRVTLQEARHIVASHFSRLEINYLDRVDARIAETAAVLRIKVYKPIIWGLFRITTWRDATTDDIWCALCDNISQYPTITQKMLIDVIGSLKPLIAAMADVVHHTVSEYSPKIWEKIQEAEEAGETHLMISRKIFD